MSRTEQKFGIPSGYSYHLPNKPLPEGKISYEQFLEWADEDTHAEWVNGEVEMPSPMSIRHSLLMSFLKDLTGKFVTIHDLGIVLLPFQMKLLGKEGPGREPDLLFLAKQNLSRLQNTFVQGPADLAVEIISPESRQRDRQEKFREYAIGGVAEYWLIDPDSQQADFYRLDQQGQYQLKSLDSEGRYYSQALPGFWLKVKWLWREPLPTPEDILRIVAGPAFEAYLARPAAPDLN